MPERSAFQPTFVPVDENHLEDVDRETIMSALFENFVS
ncbi:MAG: hypothetical protein M2R45_00707 [Verrucomicrobia subdivision 3 bacterium]|nr:hypothetical protein [Limisphaerales bacterium]MCS1414410.1 hypothetical protein [Limisphaerales bacterium]